MAVYDLPAEARALHGQTLAANTEDIVHIHGPFQHVEVINLDGGTEIYFTLDESPATVAGSMCMLVPATIGSTYMTVVQGDGGTVRLVADEAARYSVQVR